MDSASTPATKGKKLGIKRVSKKKADLNISKGKFKSASSTNKNFSCKIFYNFDATVC